MAKKQKIDFIGIGFPRCGTTWLGRCLSEHPNICFSVPKEVHFFDLDYHYEQGNNFYAKHFTCNEGENIVGEFTPEYIREPEKCAIRIKNDYPDAKLIIVMRNPVNRSFSHYLYRKHKAALYSSFDELLQDSNHPVIAESTYIEKLKPFLNSFKKEQMLFMIHEESFEKPEKYVQKVYKFLGVDDKYVPPSLTKDINRTNSNGMRFRSIEQGLNRLRWTVRGSKVGRLVLGPARAIGVTKLITKFREFNRVPVKNPEELSPENYTKLWNIMEPSIQALEKEIDIDTSTYWRPVK